MCVYLSLGNPTGQICSWPHAGQLPTILLPIDGSTKGVSRSSLSHMFTLKLSLAWIILKGAWEGFPTDTGDFNPISHAHLQRSKSHVPHRWANPAQTYACPGAAGVTTMAQEAASDEPALFNGCDPTLSCTKDLKPCDSHWQLIMKLMTDLACAAKFMMSAKLCPLRECCSWGYTQASAG